MKCWIKQAEGIAIYELLDHCRPVLFENRSLQKP